MVSINQGGEIMEKIWAPWRMEYIVAPKPSACLFCMSQDAGIDRDRLVVHITDHIVVMLNRYPYSSAHLLIAPRQHTTRLDALPETSQLSLVNSIALCQRVLEASFKPQGFNIGINIGKSGGAGVDEHLHVHIVPRWEGDTNFMTVLEDVRVIPEHLLATFDKLVPLFIRLS
jgi:ATP adenylyltransferase